MMNNSPITCIYTAWFFPKLGTIQFSVCSVVYTFTNSIRFLSYSQPCFEPISSWILPNLLLKPTPVTAPFLSSTISLTWIINPPLALLQACAASVVFLHSVPYSIPLYDFDSSSVSGKGEYEKQSDHFA